MANYIFQVITPKVDTRYLTKVRIGTAGLHAGNIIVADTLDNTILGNYENYTSQIPTTAKLGSKFMAVLVNDEFETLVDGRRPAGNPNYYSYTYNEGQVITAVFLEKHLMYNVGFDCVTQASQNMISVGNYLVPTNNSYELTAVNAIPAGTYCALKILALHNTPVGGNYGGGMAMSAICTPVFNEIDEGDYMLTFTVPNQVGVTTIDNEQNTISLTVAASRVALVPTFTTSTDATVTVNNVPQESGVTANDFTSPVTYTVTSESGDSRNYTVTISLATYDLSIDAGDNSTIIVRRAGDFFPVEAGSDVLTYGDSLTISVSASTGYQATLHVNNEPFTSGEALQVTGDVSVTSEASQIPYLLTIQQTNATVEVKDPDEFSLSTDTYVYYNEVLTITATPAEGYSSVTLLVNNEPFTSGNTHTVTGPVTVVGTGNV